MISITLHVPWKYLFNFLGNIQIRYEKNNKDERIQEFHITLWSEKLLEYTVQI